MSNLTPERREALEQMPYVAALQGVEPETIWKLLDKYARLDGVTEHPDEDGLSYLDYDEWLDSVTDPTPLPDLVKERLYNSYCTGLVASASSDAPDRDT